MKTKRFDVVVVGGGSAGAVMAARLSENPSRTVLLLEAGPAYRRQEYPDVFLDPERIGGDAEHDWGFLAAVGPEGPPGRQIAVPRGKVLGGSSAVNAAVALRALPSDFAAWAADGLTGWSFQEVLKTYRSLESADSGDDRFHGRSGPLPIHQRTYDELTPSVRAFIDTAEQQEIRMAGGGYHSVQHNPLAAFAEIVFQLYYHGHISLALRWRKCSSLGRGFQAGKNIESNAGMGARATHSKL